VGRFQIASILVGAGLLVLLASGMLASDVRGALVRLVRIDRHA